MKKITLKFENEYYGKFDTIKKTIDCEHQAGNAGSSAELQVYNILDSLCLSIFDFVDKIGLDAGGFVNHLPIAYKEYSGEETVPEHSFNTIDTSLKNADDLESFIKEFNDSDEFKKLVFDIYLESMQD